MEDQNFSAKKEERRSQQGFPRILLYRPLLVTEILCCSWDLLGPPLQLVGLSPERSEDQGDVCCLHSPPPRLCPLSVSGASCPDSFSFLITPSGSHLLMSP